MNSPHPCPSPLGERERGRGGFIDGDVMENAIYNVLSLVTYKH
jgi:hypothetical protein